jgi:hypothetical protein
VSSSRGRDCGLDSGCGNALMIEGESTLGKGGEGTEPQSQLHVVVIPSEIFDVVI